MAVSFSPIESRAITEFRDHARDAQAWEESPVRYLIPTAPSTKGLFARRLVEQLANEAGVPFASVSGRIGNRRRVGRAVCEIKFSMECPARFQQVRIPSNSYDYLVGICVRPSLFRYWLIPASDITRLFEDEQITFQHAENSRWFRAHPEQDDAFSEFRFTQKGIVEAFAQLA
jgi:hypothetical protein